MARRKTTSKPSPLTLWPDGIDPWRERRLADVRHLDRPYSLPEFASLADWKRRAAHVRQRVLLSAGLVPMPPRTPLRAKVFDKVRCDGYTVQKVHFESLPGFLCTGNLYRPVGVKGKAPGILCPHGHWPEGRVHDDPDPRIGSVPARSITLARLGFVAFSTDMVGYNDSLQLPHRPDILTDQAALWGLGLMGLQLWNSIRAIDFLQSLSDVDATRIGCTGCSGGGSQTFFAMAVDDRIKVAVPVCMVSNHMQGGCSCENGPSLRVDTTSVEIAACMAPRPMLLVSSAQDWTSNTLVNEAPEIRRIYRLFGAEDRVGACRFDAPHNYNRDSREVMYAWFARWLKGDMSVGRRIKEPPLVVPPKDKLRLFPDGKPPRGLKRGRAMVRAMRDARDAAVEADKPRTRAGLKRFCDVWGPSLEGALAAAPPTPDDTCVCVSHGSVAIDGGRAARIWVGRRSIGDLVPAALVTPDGVGDDAPVTLAVHPEGKAAWMRGTSATPGPMLQALMAAGQRVLAIDAYLTGAGETLAPIAEQYRGMNHFNAYNRSTAAERVQDVLTAVAALVHTYRASRINLVACGEAAVWALLARALWPEFARTAVDLEGARVDDDRWWLRHAYVPVLRRAGDLRTAVALAAPGPLQAFGAARFPAAWTRACYGAVKRAANVRVSSGSWQVTSVARWIGGA